MRIFYVFYCQCFTLWPNTCFILMTLCARLRRMCALLSSDITSLICHSKLDSKQFICILADSPSRDSLKCWVKSIEERLWLWTAVPVSPATVGFLYLQLANRHNQFITAMSMRYSGDFIIVPLVIILDFQSSFS